MELIFANNAQTTLAGSISNAATAANLAPGTGVFFPAPTIGSEYFVGTFTDAATGLLNEIVWVTQVIGDTITMIRAQEGTTALAWTANDLFAELWTAGQSAALVQDAQAQAQEWNYAEDTGAVNAYVVNLVPALTAHVEGMPIRVRLANTNTGASTFNPGPGAVAVVNQYGNPVGAGQLQAGAVGEFIYNGAEYQFSLPAQVQVSGQCRLGYVSTLQLNLLPLNGNFVPVAGSFVQVPAGGITVANTAVRVGGVNGQNLAASTVYLVGLNESSILEFWSLATGHSADTTAGNIGVEVITGHPTVSLVGMIATDAASHFSDFLTLSWFNRQQKINRTVFTADRSTASGTFVELNSEIRNTFLTWGDVVRYAVNGEIGTVNASMTGFSGVAFDGVSPETSVAFADNNNVSAPCGFNGYIGAGKSGLSEGRHYATMVGAAAGGTATWFTALVIGTSGTVPTNLEITVNG